MNEAYYLAQSSMYCFLALLAVLFFLLIVVAMACEKRKSLKYRQELADLYVASKIKEIAKAEEINLDVEHGIFLKWCKKRNYRDWTYDSVLEAELKEKIEEKLNKDKPKE